MVDWGSLKGIEVNRGIMQAYSPGSSACLVLVFLVNPAGEIQITKEVNLRSNKWSRSRASRGIVTPRPPPHSAFTPHWGVARKSC